MGILVKPHLMIFTWIEENTKRGRRRDNLMSLVMFFDVILRLLHMRKARRKVEVHRRMKLHFLDQKMMSEGVLKEGVGWGGVRVTFT